MAIAGNNTWVPSNRVKLVGGRLEFVAMTQNKPRDVLERNAEQAARRLLAGETITMDIRDAFTRAVKEAINAQRLQSESESGTGQSAESAG